jgi:ribonucleoside-diphosphate reductase alpha chain
VSPPPPDPLQETSFEIWDSKYRLKSKDGVPIDGSIDETYQRVARALAQGAAGRLV